MIGVYDILFGDRNIRREFTQISGESKPMLSRIKQIVSNYSKALLNGDFRSPSKAPVMIFDKMGSEPIKKALSEISSTVLPLRGEKYFLSPKIIISMLIRNVKTSLGQKRGAIDFIKTLTHLTLSNYIESCISHIQPKVVVTFIDNYYPFYSISSKFPKITFVAIQNGWRTPLIIEPIDKNTTNPVYYFCLGEHDRGLFSPKDYDPDRIITAGSLRESLWRKNQVPSKETYDICITSQWRESLFGSNSPYPLFSESLVLFYKHMAQIISSHDIKCCLAFSQRSDEEYNFFKTIFADSVYIPPRESPMTTYDLMNASKMVVTHNSTSGIEAMGMGRRALFFDPPTEQRGYYGDPKTEKMFVLDNTYESLQNRVLEVLNMNDDEYETELGEISRFMIASQEQASCGDILYNFALDCIKKGSREI